MVINPYVIVYLWLIGVREELLFCWCFARECDLPATPIWGTREVLRSQKQLAVVLSALHKSSRAFREIPRVR
jgi:hypothetical protein